MIKNIILEMFKTIIYDWNQFWIDVARVPRGCIIAFFGLIILVALIIACVGRWDEQKKSKKSKSLRQ